MNSTTPMRLKLDRTMCGGRGTCATHAPQVFSLDDWGFASLSSRPVKADDEPAVRRAMTDCPFRAISELPDSWGS